MKHFSIHSSAEEQATLLWPVDSAFGDIGILKIKIDMPWSLNVRAQNLAFKALATLKAHHGAEIEDLIVQVESGGKEQINLLRVRRSQDDRPGLTWHRGTAGNLADVLNIDSALLGPSSLPLMPELPLLPAASAITHRYQLVCDDDVQAHFDWPVPSTQGEIAVITIREPHRTEYTQRTGDLCLHAARLIFERFGIMAQGLAVHIHQPRYEHVSQREQWEIVSVQWDDVHEQSRPVPHGVWNFVSKEMVMEAMGIDESVFEADLPYSEAPPKMPPARDIMTPAAQFKSQIEKDADVLLDCLERIGATLAQGRSVGFQVGISQTAANQLIEKHGARAEKILANCTRI